MNIKTKQFSKVLALLIGLLIASVFLLLHIIVTPSSISAQWPAQRQAEERAQDQPRAQAEDPPESYFGKADGGHQCGKGDNVVKTRINFGCLGDKAPTKMSPIEDMLYAFIRFLSIGVGIVIIGSIIVAGIQYSTSEGNPEATQASKDRIRNAMIGLFVYIFAFAIVQYLVPGGALY